MSRRVMPGPRTTCRGSENPCASPKPLNEPSDAMKTWIHAARKPHRSLVPVALFDYETFEVRVRQVARHRPVPVGDAFKKMRIQLPSGQFKTTSRPIEAGAPAKILLPSPSLQGHGLICSRSGAPSVDCPAALSSRPSSLRSPSDQHIVRRVSKETKPNAGYLSHPWRPQSAASYPEAIAE